MRNADAPTVYYPGAYIPSHGCPDRKNVSYEITAELTRADGDDGTLLACGDVVSGFALFIQDQRLVWDYNMAWDHYTAEIPEALPTGPVTVTAAFERTGTYAGIGQLLVNGVETASVDMPITPTPTSTPWASAWASPEPRPPAPAPAANSPSPAPSAEW